MGSSLAQITILILAGNDVDSFNLVVMVVECCPKPCRFVTGMFASLQLICILNNAVFADIQEKTLTLGPSLLACCLLPVADRFFGIIHTPISVNIQPVQALA